MTTLDFQPEWSQISAITRAKPAVATFTAAHDFVKGQTVMFLVEREYGMREINGMIGTVSAITDDTITVDIDSRDFTPFSVPGTVNSIPQVIPVGSTNFGLTNQGVPVNPIGPSGSFKQVTSF